MDERVCAYAFNAANGGAPARRLARQFRTAHPERWVTSNSGPLCQERTPGYASAPGGSRTPTFGFEVLARIWPSPREYERSQRRTLSTVAPVQQAAGDRPTVAITHAGKRWG
jgi:hypothetical protein